MSLLTCYYKTRHLRVVSATLIGRHLSIGKCLLVNQKAKEKFIDSSRELNAARSPIYAKKRTENMWLNSASIAILMFAASFAAVPLYRLYCQSTGKGGQAFKDEENKIVGMKKDMNRPVTVNFNSSTHSSISWNFVPLQDKIIVHPGETALAFYRATNPLDELVIGVATYTVLPYEAGVYFNKIQCFCFEEQMLQPHEDVFMPVLFYIDPEFSKDPQLGSTTELTLSYTFFRSKDGELI